MMNKKINNIYLIIFFCFLAAIGIWSTLIEPNQLVVKNVNLTIPKWDKANSNLKIVVISDIHAGSSFIGIKKIRKIVEITNSQKPDVVLILGDYMIHGKLTNKILKNFTPIKPELIANELGKIKSKYGIISILGNHDYWYNATEVANSLKKNNITVLENNSIKIHTPKSFWVSGLTDLIAANPNIQKTLKPIKDDAPVIMLSHSPDMFPLIPSRISLTLAGHTHGGQVTLPILGSLIVPSMYGQHYAKGHIIENRRHIYIDSGIGTSILPVRLGNPPDITVLKLKGDK